MGWSHAIPVAPMPASGLRSWCVSGDGDNECLAVARYTSINQCVILISELGSSPTDHACFPGEMTRSFGPLGPGVFCRRIDRPQRGHSNLQLCPCATSDTFDICVFSWLFRHSGRRLLCQLPMTIIPIYFTIGYSCSGDECIRTLCRSPGYKDHHDSNNAVNGALQI